MPPIEPAAPPLDGPVRGDGFLALLAHARVVALLNALRDAPLERGELIARVGFEGSAFDRRISRLTQMGLIVPMAMPDDQRRKGYQLAHCGRDLLAIDAELEFALTGFAARGDDLKTLLVKAISDPWDRAVTRVALEARQPFKELLRMTHGTWRPEGERRSSQLGAAALTTRLRRLQRLGLVDRQPAPRQGATLYGPGEDLWRLGRVAALLALWRWNWTPGSVPRMAGDLSGLVRMLAPRVRVAEEAETRVVLHTLAPPGMDGWPDVVVCLTDGRISMPELTLIDPDARASAAPRAWCEALLGGDFDAIEIDGETASAHAVLAALAAVLRS